MEEGSLLPEALKQQQQLLRQQKQKQQEGEDNENSVLQYFRITI